MVIQRQQGQGSLSGLQLTGEVKEGEESQRKADGAGQTEQQKGWVETDGEEGETNRAKEKDRECSRRAEMSRKEGR